MLRGGTNKLKIEVGRRLGERRTCNVCLCNEVLLCPMYVRQRVEMIERIKSECEIDD